MECKISRSLLLALSVLFVFVIQSNARACMTANLEMKFNSSGELISKLPPNLELQEGQSLIIELPINESESSWVAFVDYASSISAGTPRKPKLEIDFFDNSKKETKDSNQVKYIQISPMPVNDAESLKNSLNSKKDIPIADAVIGFLRQSKKNETLWTLVTRVKVLQRKPNSLGGIQPKCM